MFMQPKMFDVVNFQTNLGFSFYPCYLNQQRTSGFDINT